MKILLELASSLIVANPVHRAVNWSLFASATPVMVPSTPVQ